MKFASICTLILLTSFGVQAGECYDILEEGKEHSSDVGGDKMYRTAAFAAFSLSCLRLL
jgi:hypothetical protein